ncbi:MAG: nitrile hydratase accessory protein [Dehalococcoidia bacterium]|nr:nitrile hydratase accessory protein [Dehalococcoidia bacterium]
MEVIPLTPEPSPEISEMEGAAALPRKNGELVFEAPWEGRAFGIAVALNEQGLYPWRSFRNSLVDRTVTDDAAGGITPYYEKWLAALETLLLQQGVVSAAELATRTEQYATGARDDDWDHED